MEGRQIWGAAELLVLGMFGRGLKATRFSVSRETGLTVSTVYDMMQRFERDGLVQRQPERVQANLSDRPPKLFYQGTTAAQDVLGELRLLIST